MDLTEGRIARLGDGIARSEDKIVHEKSASNQKHFFNRMLYPL